MSSHAHLVARYQQLRAKAMQVNNALLKHRLKDVLDEGGTNLGLLRGKTLVLGAEADMAILSDHCIYDVYRNGRNSVQRCLEQSPFAPGSDEQLVLEGMKDALFSVFVIRDVEPGAGVLLEDVLHGEQHFILDVSMSRSGTPGLMFVGRLFTVDGMTMTTGAFLPLGQLHGWKGQGILDQMKATWEKTKATLSTAEALGKYNGSLLRQALQQGSSEHVRFEGPGASESPAPLPRERSTGRVGRNDPCPCGSGKKFKNCCLKRGG